MTIHTPGKSIAFIYILNKGDSKMAGYDWKDRFEDQYYDPQDLRYRERPVYPEQEEDRYYDRQSYDRRDRRDYYPQERYDAERDYYDRQRYDRKYYDDRPSYYPVDRDYSSRDRYEREDRDRLYQERRYYRDDDYRDDMYARYRRDDPRYDDRPYLRREPSYRDEYPTRLGRDNRDQYRNPPRQEAAQGRRQGEALTDKQRSEIESFVLRLLAENNMDVTPAREEIPSIEHDTDDRRWQSVSDGSSVPSMPEYRETQAETHVVEPVIEPVVEHVVEPVIEEVPAPVVVKEPEAAVLHEAEPSTAPEIEIEHIEIPAPPVPVEKTEEVKEQPALEAVEHIEAAAVEQGIVEVPEAAHEEKPVAEEITEPVIAASEGETDKIIDEPIDVVEQPVQEVIPEKVESPEISERKKATDDIIRKVTQAVIEKKKDVKEETPEPEKEEVCEPEKKESQAADSAPEINVDETVNELFSGFEGEQSEQNEPIHIPFDETEMRDLVSEIESEPKSSELDFALEAESDSGKEEHAATVAKVEEPVSEGVSSEIKPETGSEIEAVDVAADIVAGTAAIAGIEQAIENVKEHMDDTPEEGLKQDIDSIEAALRDLIAKLRSGKEDAIKEFDTLEQESPETPELITDFGIEKAEDELHVEAAPAPETVVEEREDTVPESASDNILTEDEDTLEDQTSTVHEEPVVQEEFTVQEEPDAQEEPVAQKEPYVLEETVVTEVMPSETSNSIDSEKTDSEPIPEEVREEASSDNTEDVSEHAGEETIVEETSSATEVTIKSEPKEEVSIEQEPQQETAEPVTAEPLQTEMTELDLVAEASEERRRTEINELADTFEFTPISVDGQGNIYTSGGFNFDFGSEPVQNIPGQLKFEGNEVVEESDANDDQRLSFVLSEIDSIETSLLKGAVLELYEKQLLSPQTFTKDNCFEAENLVSDEVLRFGNSPMIRLFNDISFRIPKGARAAITGKEENSRAALTRTLGTGSGILSGTVKYNGKELNPKQWASSVMYIDSGDVISDSMTGVDFLMLCGIPQKAINTVLSRIGMAGIASRTADKMTDIQKVILLVVAGALSDSVSTIVINLNDTKVTEAEETCFALAGEYVTELGKTLIMNAFSRHCAATVCNYVVAIDNGSLAYEGDIKGFADAYGDDRLTFICKDEMLQELRDKLPEFVITSKSGLATLSGSFDREKLESILDIMLSEDIDLSKVSAEPRNFITATEGM